MRSTPLTFEDDPLHKYYWLIYPAVIALAVVDVGGLVSAPHFLSPELLLIVEVIK
jgi:hypothetical protein